VVRHTELSQPKCGFDVVKGVVGTGETIWERQVEWVPNETVNLRGGCDGRGSKADSKLPWKQLLKEMV
jgi:hypothetical protein